MHNGFSLPIKPHIAVTNGMDFKVDLARRLRCSKLKFDLFGRFVRDIGDLDWEDGGI